MKKPSLRIIALALAMNAMAASAQQKMDDMKGMDMTNKPAASAQTFHRAMGTVKSIDTKAGIVTVAHEPVKTMNWPAKTMGFKVKDRTLLDKVKDGKMVEFDFVQEDKDYVITSVK